MTEYTCDVLVIGGGGAALRSALAALEEEPSARVILATKGALGKSGVTATACSDRMAFHATLETTEPGGPEAWLRHADDIYRIGGYVSDENLARILARNSGEAFSYLAQRGVPWARRENVPDQFVTDGSAFARACYTGPYTANRIEEALVRAVRETDVTVLENTTVLELLTGKDGRGICGAAGISGTGTEVLLRTNAVVMATGGAGGIFKINVFPPGMTGDGYAMAYRAGAELVNMEFIQIGLSSVATKLACSGSMMRALPRVVNENDEEILPRYVPADMNAARIHTVLFQKGASWPVSYLSLIHI